jgi:hypothetical protein
MLPDFERSDRIGEFWATRRVAPSPNFSSTARRIVCSGQFLVGMLREAG